MKVYTSGQVAEILKVSRKTVCQLFDSGKLKGFRLAGSRKDRRIPAENYTSFIRKYGISSFVDHVFYSPAKAGKLCNLSRKAIIRRIASGKLKAFHIPGSRYWRIAQKHLIIFMKEEGMSLDVLGLKSNDSEKESEEPANS